MQGLLSVNTERQKERTAYTILNEYVQRSGRQHRVFIVHRLDRDTSGLMMFAKDEKTQRTLRDNWHEIVTDRRYVAVVEGTMEKDYDTVVSWLTDKTLYVAKFPSRKDDYDVGLWEHFSHLLATKAGINAAKTKVLATGEKYHTLLSQRFDRTQEGKRIHFASAMTLLGLSDGDNATTGHGYLDIVDFIIQNCTDVERNLQELYRRVAFNICIGNTDDHFRNHGFLLTAKGWTLSPAYDMNPTLHEYQSLLISADSNKADLSILLDTCEDYMLNKKTAEKIVAEVVEVVKEWRELANRQGISKREMDMFSGVLDERCKQYVSI